MMDDQRQADTTVQESSPHRWLITSHQHHKHERTFHNGKDDVVNAVMLWSRL